MVRVKYSSRECDSNSSLQARGEKRSFKTAHAEEVKKSERNYCGIDIEIFVSD